MKFSTCRDLCLASINLFVVAAIHFPAKAGVIVGDYSSDLTRYIEFTDSLNRKNSTGYLLLSDSAKNGGNCTGVLINPTWVVSSAHCVSNLVGEKSGRFISETSTANIIGVFTQKGFNSAPLTYYIPSPLSPTPRNYTDSFRQNTPQRAIDDIALFKLDRDLTKDGMAFVTPSRTAPSASFVGNFAGYGLKGDGRDSVNLVSGLSLPPNATEADLKNAATVNLLGGSNVINSFAGGLIFNSDFDDGASTKNIDGNLVPLLPNEFTPAPGDSGAGLFDSNSGALVGLVSGGGYGNRLVGGAPRSYDVFEYGSLAFYTPTAKHAYWLARVMELNKEFSFVTKAIVPRGEKIKFNRFSNGDLAADLSFELSDSLFTQEFQLIEDIYSEDADNLLFERVFAINTPIESVPEPSTIVGLVVAVFSILALKYRLKS